MPHGFTTTYLASSGDSTDAAIAQILQASLKQLGITMDIQNSDPSAVHDLQSALNYDISHSYWTMDIADPDELVQFAVLPAGGGHSFETNYTNKQAQQLAAAGREDLRPDRAAEALQPAADPARRGSLPAAAVLPAAALRHAHQRQGLLREADRALRHGCRVARLMEYAAYILKRLVTLIPVLFGISLLVFFLIHLVPGDPAKTLLGSHVTDQAVAELHHKLGLDKPLWQQYLSFLGRLLHGDLGESYQYNTSVSSLVWHDLAPTLWLIIVGAVFAVLISVPLAVWAASRQNKLADNAIRTIPLIGLGMPAFWLGIMLVLLLSLKAGAFPASGFGDGLANHVKSIILPALTVALALVPILVRSLRASMLRVLQSDYVVTARSKGISTSRVVLRPRAAQRGDLVHHRPRREHRLPDRVDAGGREGVRPQRHRVPDDHRHLQPRLPHRAGRHPDLRGHGRPREPDDRPRARRARPPGAAVVTALPFPGRTATLPARKSRRKHNVPLIAGLVLFGLIVLAAVLRAAADLLGPDPAGPAARRGSPPGSPGHLLGTDQFGRDVLSRLLYGARIDLKVGVLAVVSPFIIGTVLGLISGWFGGWFDTFIMRVVDVVVAFPFFVLVIALVFALGAGTGSIYVAITMVGWVAYCRIVRGEMLVAKEQEYTLAARASGLPTWRILLRHLLPNVVLQAIVYSMSDIVLTILAIVTLGYLGLGVPPPTPDWGSMIQDGQQFLLTQWYLATIPGLAVVVTGLALALIADGLVERFSRR